MRILCNRLTEIEHGRQRVMFHNTYRWNVRGLSPTTSEKCTYTDRGVVASSCLGKQPIRAQDQHSLRVGMMSFEKNFGRGKLYLNESDTHCEMSFSQYGTRLINKVFR